MVRKKQVRTWEWQDWPQQTRAHYIKLFSLQERLRARLKLAQELAKRNYDLKYSGNPRKTNPIRIAVKQQEDHLVEYRDEQLPKILARLVDMQREIDEIKKSFSTGRHPKWYKQTLEVEKLTKNIWKKMKLLEVHFILTSQADVFALKESNETIIHETRTVLETAWKIRPKLLFLRPGQTAMGLDEYGIYEIIIDLAPRPEAKPDDLGVPESEEQHIIDLTTLPVWQQDQHKKRRG